MIRQPALMQFCSGQLMQFLSGVDMRRPISELGQIIASNPGAAGLKDISGVIVLNGGLPIRVGDEVIGSVGVGGSPSGDRDEACAKAGLDKVADQLK
jgi:uncharacterized protein GlcG (DUF336 family)